MQFSPINIWALPREMAAFDPVIHAFHVVKGIECVEKNVQRNGLITHLRFRIHTDGNSFHVNVEMDDSFPTDWYTIIGRHLHGTKYYVAMLPFSLMENEMLKEAILTLVTKIASEHSTKAIVKFRS